VARLPRHSLYKAAIDNDDEYAVLAELLPTLDDATPRVPLAGYSELAVRLDNVFDAINAVNETLLAVNGGKASVMHRPNRAPRPETASQRLTSTRKREQLDSIVDRMTGGR
jgi:hypothetical protein